MLIVTLNVISLSLACAFLGLSIIHAYNVECNRKSAVNVGAAGEWTFIIVCTSIIAVRMSVSADWVDWTVSAIFLTAGAIHVRLLRLIRKAKVS